MKKEFSSAYLSASIACIMCFHYVMLWNVSRLYATKSENLFFRRKYLFRTLYQSYSMSHIFIRSQKFLTKNQTPIENNFLRIFMGIFSIQIDDPRITVCPVMLFISNRFMNSTCRANMSIIHRQQCCVSL